MAKKKRTAKKKDQAREAGSESSFIAPRSALDSLKPLIVVGPDGEAYIVSKDALEKAHEYMDAQAGGGLATQLLEAYKAGRLSVDSRRGSERDDENDDETYVVFPCNR